MTLATTSHIATISTSAIHGGSKKGREGAHVLDESGRIFMCATITLPNGTSCESDDIGYSWSNSKVAYVVLEYPKYGIIGVILPVSSRLSDFSLMS